MSRSFLISHRFTNASFQHLADVDQGLTNCSLPYEQAELKLQNEEAIAEQSYLFDATSGSRVITLYYDDSGFAFFQWCKSVTSMVTFNPKYHETALNNASSVCFNTLHTQIDHFSFGVQWPIMNVHAGAVQTCIIHHEQKVVFEVSADQGSLLDVTTDYGNGEYAIVHFRDGFPNGSATLPPYEYPVDGTYNWTVTVENYLNSTKFNGTVKSEEIISEVRLTSKSSAVIPRTNELRVGFDWINGTNEDVYIWCDGHELIPVVNGPSNFGHVVIPASLHHVGTHQCVWQMLNCINFKVTTHEIDLDFTIEGLSFETASTYLEPGERFDLQASVDNGSRITYDLIFPPEIGPNITFDYFNSVPVVNISMTTPPVNETGYYMVILIVRNSVSSCFATLQLGVERILIKSQYALNYTNQVFRPIFPVDIFISSLVIQPATGVEVSIDFNETNSQNISHDFEVSKFGYNHYFVDYGRYYNKICLQNNLTNFCLDLEFIVGVVLTGLSIQAEKPFIMVDLECAKFWVHVNNGSKVVYNISFGDDYVSGPVPRTNDDWGNSDDTLLCHNYTTPGVYVVIVRAFNIFGDSTVILDHAMIVQYIIPHTQIRHLETHPLPPGYINFTIEVAEDSPTPTNASCTFDHGDGHVSEPLAMDWQSSGNDTFCIFPYQYSNIQPGGRTVRVNCSNLISNRTYELNIMLHEPISPIFGPEDTIYVKRGGQVTLMTYITDGSHVNYTADFNDTTIKRAYFVEPPKHPHGQSFIHSYQDIGNRSVTVRICNDVSCQTKTFIKKFVVQDPVTSIHVLINSPIEFPRLAELEIKQNNYFALTPTDACCIISFYPGSPLLKSCNVRYPTTFPYVHRNAFEYSRLGSRVQQGYCNCSNMVSFRFVSFQCILEEKIEGLSVTFNAMSLRQNLDRFEIYISLRRGTAVNVRVNIEDGTEDVIPFYSTFPQSPIIHTIPRLRHHGEFGITIVASNAVSSETYESPEKLIVQAIVLPFLIESPGTAAIPPGIVKFFVTVNPTLFSDITGTDPYIKYECKEYVWTTNAASLGIDPPEVHYEEHQFDKSMVGKHTCKVSVYNLVSEKVGEVEISLEAEIGGLQLVEHNPSFIHVGETSSYTASVVNGSHVAFHINFHKGMEEISQETIYHPNQLDSTSNVDFSHKFEKSGNYSLTVMAANNLGNETVTSDGLLIVQQGIELIAVEAPEYVVARESTEFNFSIPTYPPGPDSVHLCVDPGDGKNVCYFTEDFSTGMYFIVRHRYGDKDVGLQHVAINASNLVSRVQLAREIYVYHKIENVKINCTDYTLTTGEELFMCVTRERGTEVTYYVDFGDNQTDVQTSETDCDPFVHVYEPGNYSISVRGSNKVSNYTTVDDKKIVVQNPIIPQNLEAKLVGETSYIGNPPGKMKLELNVVEGHSPTDVHIQLNPGDTKIANYFTASFPYVLSYEYGPSERGLKNVTIFLENLVSSGTLYTKIDIIEPISGIEINFEDYVETSQDVNITISLLTGVSVTCTINHGDGTSHTTPQLPGLEYTFKHQYLEPGVISIEATCQNVISILTKVADESLKVQNPVVGLSLVPPDVQAAGELAVIALNKDYSTPTPTNATITIYYDDGKEETADLIDRLTLPFTHVYREAGTYHPWFLAENHVSSQKANKTLMVQEKIKGLVIVASMDGVAEVSYTFPPHSMVELKADFEQGSHVQYEWVIDGITVVGSPTDYFFTKTIDILLTVYNQVNTVSVNQTIYVVSQVQIVHVDYLPSSKVNKIKDFVIRLSGNVEDICFAFDFHWNDTRNIEWCGDSKETCQKDTRFRPQHHISLDWAKDSKYSCTFKFKQIGQYNLTIYGFDGILNTSAPVTFSISVRPCSPPLIDPIEGGSLDTCLRYKRARDVLFHSSAFDIVFRCEATKNYTSYFTIHTADENGRVATINIENALGDNEGGNSFLLRKNKLEYGVYFARYHLSHPDYNAENDSSVCFQLEESGMTTCLNGLKYETVGYGRKHVISTKTNNCTDDPDKISQDFTYQYYCWPADLEVEGSLDNLVNGTDEIPDGGE